MACSPFPGERDKAQDGIGWIPVASIVAGIAVGVMFVRRQRSLEDPRRSASQGSVTMPIITDPRVEDREYRSSLE